MKGHLWLVLLALLVACSPRQALVTLELEPPLMKVLSSVDVTALDADDKPRGRSARLDLSASYVRDGRASFGAIPARDGSLRLRFRGWDDDGELRVEQTLATRTKRDGITRLTFVLSGTCLDQIPCDPDFPDDEGGPEDADGPACLLGSALDCGACGNSCNMSHVLLSMCTGGECTGECTAGFENCDGDLGTNGCETSLLTEAENCGRCGTRCPYGTCEAGSCVRQCDGTVYPGRPTLVQAQVQRRMVGFRVLVEDEGVLVGLGVNILRGPEQADTRFRMALYEDNTATSGPGVLVGQTAETSVHALERAQSGALSDCNEMGLEMRVPDRPRVHQGIYWFFFFAAAEIPFYVSLADVPVLRSQDDIDYDSLERMPNFARDRSPLKHYLTRAPVAYVVRAPGP